MQLLTKMNQNMKILNLQSKFLVLGIFLFEAGNCIGEVTFKKDKGNELKRTRSDTALKELSPCIMTFIWFVFVYHVL